MEKIKGFRLIPSILIGLLALLSCPLNVLSQVDNQAAAASEPVEYVIEDIQGQVQVLEEGSKDWEVAQEGQVVESGDEVKAGDNSEATLMMQSDTSVHLGAGTDLKVDQIEANETGGFLSRLEVLTGNILADVKKHLDESHSTFEVDADGVVCGVRGTAFEVTAQGDTAQVATHEGAVAVGNGTESHMVEAGQFSEFQRGRFRLRRRLQQDEIQRFQKWRAFRQRVWQKRFRRLEDIRDHRRSAWVRRHPRAGKALRRREWRKRRFRDDR